MSRRRDPSLRLNNHFQRKINTRNLRERFLIICEGERTEPNYFRKFPLASKYIKVIGKGYNTVSLVGEAIAEKEANGDGEYDQVWCVFDKDSFSDKDFNEAIALAKKNKIKCAYSNEAFELWYLLHFDYHHAAISRNLYSEKLSERLSCQYKKNAQDMYFTLLDKQKDAIRNAENLLKSYDPHNPAKNNPCTTVHLLIQELLKPGPGFKN